MSINLCAIVIIEMKSQSKTDRHENSHIILPKGALPYGGAFLRGGRKDTMCEYCEKAEPLITGKTNDTGIAIQYPGKLNAYGYNVHGTESNALTVKIKFCPMCGRKLESDTATTEQ